MKGGLFYSATMCTDVVLLCCCWTVVRTDLHRRMWHSSGGETHGLTVVDAGQVFCGDSQQDGQEDVNSA